jgi:hypothetical protein
LAWRFAVQKTIGAMLIEPQHPIPDDLKPNAADLRGLGAGRTVVDRRKCQKPTGLRTVFALFRQIAELRRTKITPQWYRNRHGEPPSFATLNQNPTDLGILHESEFQGFGITT